MCEASSHDEPIAAKRQESAPIKDGYGKHWGWEGNRPYWWCPDDDLCGPHPTRKAAVECYEKRHV